MPWYRPEPPQVALQHDPNVRKHHIVPSPSQERVIHSDATIVVAVSTFGEGKCQKFDTPIVMYDGTIKAVQDIVVGDQLMGEDSLPRTVLSLGRGRDEMFEIVPIKGEPFTVNAAHILSLKRSRQTPCANEPPGMVIDIPLREYMAMPAWKQRRWKLYHVPLDFPEQIVTVEPYLLGIWLGDGTATRTEITTPDAEVVEYLEKIAAVRNLSLRCYRPLSGSKGFSYTFSGKSWRSNTLLDELRAYGLMPEKYIPHVYKCNSREVRLEVLAGLIDSDGWVNRTGYQITQKSERLAHDIAFVARSLGLQCEVKPQTGRIKARHFEGQYFRVYINGDCSEIPVKILRKRVPKRQQAKDVLLSGIKAIIPQGVGDYYGFTLDGNHRYLLRDLTVTHNTWSMIMSTIFHAYRNGKFLRAAIIRDTHENLKRTVVVAFQAFFAESQLPHKWSNDFKKLWIYSAPPVEVDLLGIDDLASVANLQGGEWGLIWLEEPCPYTDSRTASAGLSEDVYNAALVRCARQKDVKARLQISSNHPDEDHWFYKRCMEAPDGPVDPRTPLITKETIEFPSGENTHLKAEARQAAIAAYANDPVAYARFVTGEATMRFPGKPVTGRVFNPAFHIAPIPLEPVEGLPGFVGWDSWGNPAAVIGQQWPDGRIWILDEIVDAEDVRDVLHNHLNPLIQSPRWKDKCFSWRQIGDRTMRQPDQSRHNECAADAVEQEFDPGMQQKIPFEPGPQTWEHMRLGIMHALQWIVRGQPAVLIDPARCKRLIAGLKGRWHYPTNKAGVVTQRHPYKDEWSHICDAWANAVCVVAPWSAQMHAEYTKKRTAGPQPRRRLAASYSTPAVPHY